MVRIRDYVIPILLYMTGYYGVMVLPFLFKKSHIYLFIFVFLLITLCLFYHLYKKQILDWFVGIAIVINIIIAPFYLIPALLLAALTSDGEPRRTDIITLVFLGFFSLFISFIPLFFTIQIHNHKSKLESLLSLSCMVLALLLFILYLEFKITPFIPLGIMLNFMPFFFFLMLMISRL